MSNPTLTYWDSNPNPGRTEAFSIAGTRFAESEGLAFNYVPVGIKGYPEKVLQAWSEGSGPDVIDVWPAWLSKLIASKQLLQLDPWVESWERVGDYDPSHRALSRSVGDHYWFLACDLFIQGTHYRTDLVQAAGLEDPKALDERGEWTLDRFGEYARALHDPENGIHGLAMRGGQGGELTALNLMVSANSGRLWDESGNCLLDTPAAIDALARYIGLAYPKGLCQPTAPDDGYREFAWLFYEGRAAMMLHNDDAAKAVQGRYLGTGRYSNCRLPDDHGSPWLGLAGFGVGVNALSPVADPAARYACYFVENYSQHLTAGTRASGESGKAGVSCGPVLPWPVKREAHMETFRRLLEKPDHLFPLPWDRPGFPELIHTVIQPDIADLMRGQGNPAACARSWAARLSVTQT